LSIRDPFAGGIDTFRGPGTIREWEGFYTAWLNDLGAGEPEWNENADRRQTAAVIEHRGAEWRCDVLLSATSEGDVECVVNLVQVPGD
jgi:hypothetical protein